MRARACMFVSMCVCVCVCEISIKIRSALLYRMITIP